MAAAPSPSPSGGMAAKAEEIRRVLSEPAVDLWKLRDLALTEGGLVNGAFSCPPRRARSAGPPAFDSMGILSFFVWFIYFFDASLSAVSSLLPRAPRPLRCADSLRKLAWPKLVGVHNDLTSTPFDFSSSLVSA